MFKNKFCAYILLETIYNFIVYKHKGVSDYGKENF